MPPGPPATPSSATPAAASHGAATLAPFDSQFAQLDTVARTLPPGEPIVEHLVRNDPRLFQVLAMYGCLVTFPLRLLAALVLLLFRKAPALRSRRAFVRAGRIAFRGSS